MPYRTFSIDEVADYLHVTRADVDEWVKTNTIPHQKRGGHPVFMRGEVDAWASQKILSMEGPRLQEYHQSSTRGTRPVLDQDALMPDLLNPAYIEPALPSKTKRSAIHDMVAFAETTGRVLDAMSLRQSVEAREDMCSTGLPGGLALLHCRHHEEYQFDGSFITLGRAVQAVPFGAPDGRPTWFFFLICCNDEHLHLHTLARICMMAMKTDLLEQLFAAKDAQGMYEAIVASELAALAGRKHLENGPSQ